MLTKINSVNSNQEFVESYVDEYRNECNDTKIKIIDKFSAWLDTYIDNYLHQVDSDVWIDILWYNFIYINGNRSFFAKFNIRRP